MSYPLDVAAQNACLDAMLGSNRGATMPTSFELALFNGHPLLGGTELTSTGGYVRPVVANTTTNFPAAASGRKIAALVPIANPSGPWSDTATHYKLIDHADSVTGYWVGRLTEDLAVVGTETGLGVTPALYWNTES